MKSKIILIKGLKLSNNNDKLIKNIYKPNKKYIKKPIKDL